VTSKLQDELPPASTGEIVVTTTDDPGAMTVLLARDTGSGTPRMSKRFTTGEAGMTCHPYDDAWLFTVRTVSVAEFSLLAFVLTSLKSKPHACAIRGRLLPHADPLHALRRVRDRDGQPATFEDAARTWILLDFDHLKAEQFPDPRVEPEAAARAVRAQLPEGLRGVACFWSFSSSTGMKPGKFGVHLYLLLGKALAWRDAEAFITACDADVAMARTVQVHYTAAPVIVPPLKDPLEKRFGVLSGDDRAQEDVVASLVALGHERIAAQRAARQHAALPTARKTAVKNTSPAPARKKESATSISEPAAVVDEATNGMIGDGYRHSHLTSIAGFARSRGLDAEGLLDLLSRENSVHCAPSLAEEEVMAMAKSFARYPITRQVSDPWMRAVVLAAGLIRHGACEDALINVVFCLLKDECQAIAIVHNLHELPQWQLQAAESMPHFILDHP